MWRWSIISSPGNAHTPRPMHLVTGWYYIPLANVPCLMHTSMSYACKHLLIHPIGHWHILPLAQKPYLMGAFCWPMSISLNLMHTQHRNFMHAFDDDACRRLRSLSICVQTTLDAWRLCLMLHEIGQNILANAFRKGLKFLNKCAHATFNMCKPWLMVPIIVRCRLANTRRPWLIF